MSKASESLRQPLRKAEEEMQAELELTRTERQTLRERELGLQSELGAVQSALAKIDPDYERPNPKKKPKARTNGGISMDRLILMVTAMRKIKKAEGTFTQNGVRLRAKVSPSQSSAGFALLRDEGIIGKRGKVEGSSAEKWDFDNEAGFDQLVKARTNV